MTQDEAKRLVARRAVEFVQDGMVVGLGTGTTATLFIRELAARKLKIRCVASSAASAKLAKSLGIRMHTLRTLPELDMYIDGADEIARVPGLGFGLIKGGGGALLREKIVAQASLREVIVVDESKMSHTLGVKHAVPVEVAPFGWRPHVPFLEKLGARVTVRRRGNGTIFRTDQNNILLDADFGPIGNPSRLASDLKARAGIVEHGLFLQLARDVIVAGAGGLRHLVRQ